MGRPAHAPDGPAVGSYVGTRAPAMLPLLDQFHAHARRSPALQRFTAFTRVLLAVAFIPPGLKKVLGLPFTVMPTTHPVGAFFDSFLHAGSLYAFVGWAQIVAAVLLVVPATATLGAVLYAPIIAVIVVVTVSMGFEGTGVVTALMALACLYLLCWDYDRLKAVLPARRRGPLVVGRREYAVQAAAWAIAGAVAYGAAAWAGVGNVGDRLGWAGAGAGLVGGAAFGLALAWHFRQMDTATQGAAIGPNGSFGTAAPPRTLAP